MSDTFLVCGLGSLGENCVIALKKFGVKVVVIEKNPPPNDTIKDLLPLIDLFIIGDCSDRNILLESKIEECRAALIVTTSEKVNVATAITIRELNQKTRLVMRSAQKNLNNLLSKQLGNFIAYEPTQLPANAYALSALGEEILGFFTLNEQKIRITKIKINQFHSWCNYNSLYELNSRSRRILSHYQPLQNLSSTFNQWNPYAKILPQDTIICVETEDHFRLFHQNINNRVVNQSFPINFLNRIKKIKIKGIKYFRDFWLLNRKQQIRGVVIFSSLITLILLITGTLLFKYFYKDASFLSSFYVTAILLLGGYSDLFDTFEPIENIPQWLQFFSLILILTGTAFVGVLYALLTQALLSSQFQFAKKSPPIPTENHIVVVGFGRIGREIIEQLQTLKQSVLAISFNSNIEVSNWLNFPLIVGKLQDSLILANLDQAKSIVIVTDDDILNLEVALMAQNFNPYLNLIIRTNSDNFSDNLTKLLPHASIISAYEVAAEAFTGAAFGENILELYRFEQQTILVTEYEITSDDTLHNLLLSDIAYGYGVIPIFYCSSGSYNHILMPSDDILLAVGDRLIVLATVESLKSIEQGKIKPKQWEIEILSVKSDIGIFEGTNAIARIIGCSLKLARETMENLPQTLPVKVYHHQGVRLINVLKKNQVVSEIHQII
ncbi:potassium channel protein [Geminocystis sp. NIES-3708]|uniref:potassium channel family protein n=1 Tax=Geminocystis sp. NIES-3708 TaxID=1615909 RepID=UPI0005FC7148|nr:potassium channel protein [Geminocystis sp. NIES-3708]BAQ61938.1 potassium channel protein [Geminocystis sp. NIES-3708]